MKPFVLLCLFALFIPSSNFSQTPSQTYFEWTEMPFSKEELALRRTRLIEILQKEHDSGLIIMPARDGFSYGETFRQLDNFYYFTGLELPNSILLIDLKNKSSVIYVPKEDLRFSSASRPNDFPGRPLLEDTEISNQSGIALIDIANFENLIEKQAADGVNIHLDHGRPGDFILASEEYIHTPSPAQIIAQTLRKKHKVLNFKNSYNAIAKVRMIKSPTEIQLMRKATEINVQGIITAAKTISPGLDERYLEGKLEGDYKIHGAQRLAFGSIIKSGPNSLWPWRILATHYNRRNRIMKAGELVIFDVGCEYQNYVSDVGRTFPVSGTFSVRQKEILTMEVAIADAIIGYIKPGIKFADLRELTDRIIPEDAKKYMQVGLFFGHHLGLSAGDPNLSEAKLEPGMIFTVEPWYYNHDEGISVFTEDVVLVTSDGCEVLSNALPRTPADLEKLME